MSKFKKKVRNDFRSAVFARDDYACRVCGAFDYEKVLDAHHITDRNELPKGGYVVENGISLCEDCHAKAELYHSSKKVEFHEGFHPNDLYKLINSSFLLAREKSFKLK